MMYDRYIHSRLAFLCTRVSADGDGAFVAPHDELELNCSSYPQAFYCLDIWLQLQFELNVIFAKINLLLYLKAPRRENV
jgi:hypothetical protein